MNATLQQTHVEQLRDLYDAETELVETLSKLAAAATDPELKKGFLAQRKESRENAARLKKLCADLEKKNAAGRGRVTSNLLTLLASLKAEHRTVAAYTRALNFARSDTFGLSLFGAGAMPSRVRLYRE